MHDSKLLCCGSWMLVCASLTTRSSRAAPLVLVLVDLMPLAAMQPTATATAPTAVSCSLTGHML